MKMDTKKRVCVVGGGAAGLMAAVCARRQGAAVTILEKNARVGKKILATGNGRCNYTNLYTDPSYYCGKNPRFAGSALSNFTADDAIRFFEKLGIAPKVEDGGRVYPMSEQASSILDVFLYELRETGITVFCDTPVIDIARENGRFIIEAAEGRAVVADRVIMATGGKAMPSSGSDGSGYALAAKLGHTVTAVFPALVQLMLEGPYFKRLEGVKFAGTAQIIADGKSVAEDRGDILFANYGLSGPPVLQISRKAGELLNKGKEAHIKIVIMDKMSREDLTKLLHKRFQNAPRKPADFSLVGLINKRLIPVVLQEAGINDVKRPAGELSAQEQEAIAAVLTDWRFQIRGTRSWPSAQVTAGGIDTAEIDENTLESKLVKGLYFAGEIIDVDGPCGGFNLQWAWSSGFTAGQNAAR